MTVKGQKRGNYPPRPHSWKSGPDEFRHSLYVPWLKAKAQANFRKEEWTLTFEEWFDLWKNDWHKRGRKADSTCMTRLDSEKGWTADNTVLMLRREQLILQGENRKGMTWTKTPSTKPKKIKEPKVKEVKAKKVKDISFKSSIGEQIYGKSFYK